MAETRQRESAVDRIRERVEEKAARRAAAAKAAQHHGDPDEPPPAAPGADRLPGVTAEKPTDIPWRGWKQILKRAWAENKADNMPIISGGVAFFGFLSVFPTLIAMISIYGLIASPATVSKQVDNLAKNLPRSATDLISTQLKDITTNSGGALTVGLIVSILAALWSASGGVSNLITAVNLAYDEVEARNFVKLKLTALALTLGGIVIALVTFGLVAVVPAVISTLPLGVVGTILAQIATYLVLLAVFAGALAILYRVAPDRDAPRFRWVSLGSVVAVLVLALATLGFGFYVSNFANYDRTYGSLGGVIVFLLWLWIANLALLLGAEFDSELERGRELQAGIRAEQNLRLETRSRQEIVKADLAEAGDERDGRILRLSRGRATP